MNPEVYRMLADREDAYWWHRARRKMTFDLLRRHGVEDGCRWLDLGCGPGGNLRIADALGARLIVGLDISPIAIAMAQAKNPAAAIVRGDLKRLLPFADESFNVATIFNVLYHAWIASEADVLSEVRRVLRPTGVVVITEPAFAALKREMDVASMGRKRYRREEIAALCRSTGFVVEFATYFTSFGFPLLYAMTAARRLRSHGRSPSTTPSPDMKPLNPLINATMHLMARLEAAAIARGCRMPFGTTLLVIARKAR